MIIYITIDTEDNFVSAVNDSQEISIDYSACNLSEISVKEIINDFLT